jgi:hypothetical protein
MLVDVLPRATAHGVPLRSVGHLDQPVVVAEADQGGDGKRSIWSVGQDQMQPIIGRK